jgi:hypothetical protein
MRAHATVGGVDHGDDAPVVQLVEALAQTSRPMIAGGKTAAEKRMQPEPFFDGSRGDEPQAQGLFDTQWATTSLRRRERRSLRVHAEVIGSQRHRLRSGEKKNVLERGVAEGRRKMCWNMEPAGTWRQPDSRKGHYMPKQLIESQFLALEEPREGIVIDANWPSEKAVTTIRSTLGK